MCVCWPGAPFTMAIVILALCTCHNTSSTDDAVASGLYIRLPACVYKAQARMPAAESVVQISGILTIVSNDGRGNFKPDSFEQHLASRYTRRRN